VLVRRATPDRVLPELRPFGGTVLRTSLSTEQEARLRQALEKVQPEGGGLHGRPGAAQPSRPASARERDAAGL
jgi:hypothetical protein